MIVAVAVVSALSVSVPTFALHENVSPEREGTVRKLEQASEPTVTAAEDATKSTVQNVSETTTERLQSQQEKIEARKAELKQRLEQRAAERKQRLEGRRLAQCQNRQDNINALISKSAEVGQAKLVRIQRFEEGIKKFYVDQALTSETYESVLATVDDKEAQAIAALDTMAVQKFDCLTVDGVKPSDAIKSVHETKRVALKEYRDSVQELLKTVRQAFTEKMEVQDEAQ